MRLTKLSRFKGIIFALSLISLCAKAPGQANQGQQLFSTCAACHGLDGNGGEHAPNIASDQRVQRMPDSALIAIVTNGIPAAGMPSFSKLWDARQIHAVVEYLRSLQGSGQPASISGNASKGQELFFGSAQCGACHMANGKGSLLGADLTSYGSGRPAAKIKEAILAPYGNVSPLRGAVSVVTKSSKTYTGILRNEDNFSLQMQTADGKLHLFEKTELAKINHEPKSLMHTDYDAKLSDSQMTDLISFLSVKGSPRSDDDDDQ